MSRRSHSGLGSVLVAALALAACGGDESATAKLRAGPNDGADLASVTYTVNGEATLLTASPDDDLELEIDVTGSYEIEIVITNSSDEGTVRCAIGPGGRIATGTESATCRAVGTVEDGELSATYEIDSTDR